MLDKLLSKLRDKFSSVPADLRSRFRNIDAWLANVPIAEARSIALELLRRPEWFNVEEPSSSMSLPENTPSSVRDLFGQFSVISGKEWDLRLVAREVGPSSIDPSRLHIGWHDAHTELCSGANGEALVVLANDVPPDEALEGEFASVYHAILKVAAILEYITPPQAAV